MKITVFNTKYIKYLVFYLLSYFGIAIMVDFKFAFMLFAHVIKSYFKEVFELFGEEFKTHGVEAKNGLKDMFSKISQLKNKDEILAKFDEILSKKAKIWALNESASNFDVPNDVIIDASVPALIRNSGKVKDKDGELNFSLCMIPDRTYARVYEACVADFKEHGALDVSNIGSVANVGLMAKKAEEYGSHDKTFIAKVENDFWFKSKTCI